MKKIYNLFLVLLLVSCSAIEDLIVDNKTGFIIQKNDVIECSAKKNLKIKDLTGAGDLFAAGFLHGYINNLSLKNSLEEGTEMSSKIIQRIGARLN